MKKELHERIARHIAGTLLGVQYGWSEKIGGWFNRQTVRVRRTVFFAFTATCFAMCGYLVIAGFNGNGNQSSLSGHENISAPIIPNPEDGYRKMLLDYTDSIRKYKPERWDSLMKFRPGLADSIARLRANGMGKK